MYPDAAEIKRMTEYVQQWTYSHLMHTTDLDQIASAEIATNAANRYAAALALAIKENHNSHPARKVTRPDAAELFERGRQVLRDASTQPARALPRPHAPPIRCCGATFRTIEEWKAHASPVCRPKPCDPWRHVRETGGTK